LPFALPEPAPAPPPKIEGATAPDVTNDPDCMLAIGSPPEAAGIAEGPVLAPWLAVFPPVGLKLGNCPRALLLTRPAKDESKNDAIAEVATPPNAKEFAGG